MSQAVEILLVEDAATHAQLIAGLLAESEPPCRVRTIADGLEALEFLRRQARHAAAPRPNLILLDLSLPRRHGYDVLSEIKRDPHLRSIPVIVITASDDEADIVRSYRLGASCHVVKPAGAPQFAQTVRTIREFWLQHVRLPELSGAHSQGL